METGTRTRIDQTPPQHKSHSFDDLGESNPKSRLAPSPTFHDRRKRLGESKDEASGAPDFTTPTTPRPRRPDIVARGLSIQLPAPKFGSGSAPAFAVPLSPTLQTYDIYMQPQNITQHSPATSLPRHSRGLDFSRACTTLHHSTLADKGSPESSPVITQKAVAIPGRKLSMSSMLLDSPAANGPASLIWSSQAHDRTAISSSLGSVNMLGSDSESSSSDDDASMGADDNEDPLLTTPQVHKLHNPQAVTPFHHPPTPSSSVWANGSSFSPAQASLMKTIRRARIQKTTGKRSSRKSSSSASNSGYSSMASPRTTSPPPLRSIETATGGSGYFAPGTAARSRRESLAFGTDKLNLSSGNDSGDEASQTAPSTPGVVRRPVTRRGNLLPKTKGFARIRAALLEEAAPVDTEVRREAETIRQVRERDGRVSELETSVERPSQTTTAGSSPSLLPVVPESTLEEFGRDLDSDSSGNKGLALNFAEQASRNSGGLHYWNRFDFSKRTPPPPSFGRQSSVLSDNYMDSPTSDVMTWRRPRARSSASDASEALQSSGNTTAFPAGVNDDVHLQKFKRRREDDFDIATIKRRAVSPGMSAQNSPIFTNSPSQRDANGSGWGQPPDRKDRRDPSSIGSDTSQPARSGSTSSISVASNTTVGPGNLVSNGKKVGLQPMADTNDGLMKMTIE